MVMSKFTYEGSFVCSLPNLSELGLSKFRMTSFGRSNEDIVERFYEPSRKFRIDRRGKMFVTSENIGLFDDSPS